MDKHYLGFSVKNIPIPLQNLYMESLIHKLIESINKWRRRAHFFDLPKCGNNIYDVDNFGFKIYKIATSKPALANFERDLLNMNKHIKCSRYSNPFQKNCQTFMSCRTKPVMCIRWLLAYIMIPDANTQMKNTLNEIVDSRFEITFDLCLLDMAQPYSPKYSLFNERS